MTVRQALNEAMAEEMRRDKDIFVMGEEVAEYQGAYKVTQGLLQEFGAKRVVDTPITEHGFAGLGVGAAFAGLRPIVEFMTFNFAMQAIDQIINSAAKQLYMSGGQVHGADRLPRPQRRRVARRRPAQPGLFGLVQPRARPHRHRALQRRRRQGPAEGGDPLAQSGGLPRKRNALRLDRSRCPRSTTTCCRSARRASCAPGKDVTIVSFSIGMRYATQATEKLVAAGVDVELIDLRTLRPMDTRDGDRQSVKKTGRCVTVEEGWPQGGIGAEIASRA